MKINVSSDDLRRVWPRLQRLKGGEHQAWIAGEYVMSVIDYNQIGKVFEVEVLSDVAAERGWL